MATGSCAYCTLCSVEVAYTPPDPSNFHLLVRECEERDEQRLQNSEEETFERDEASIIKWLLVNASDIEFYPWDLESIVHRSQNYKDQQLLAFLHDQRVYIDRQIKYDYEEENRNALVCAARIVDPEIITWLIEHVSGAIEHGPIIRSALFEAAEQGKLKNMVRLLNYVSTSINSAYEHISMLATSKGYFDIIKYLYQVYYKNDRGACLEAFNTVIQEQYYHIAQWLIDNGLKINYLDHRHNYSMQYALKNGRIEVIQWLITQNVNLDFEDGLGSLSLHIAAKFGHLNIITWLIEKGFSIKERNRDGVTPLQIVAKEGHIDCVKYLVHIGANVLDKNEYGMSVLHFACQSKNYEIVKFLVEHGANVHVLDCYKNSVLHNAAKCFDIVKYLVEKGCNVHVQNSEKKTVLSLAVEASSFQIVDWLVKETNINIKDVIKGMYNGICTDAIGNKWQLLKLLLELLPSWDINGIYDYNETLLHRSVFYIEAVTMLLDHGADVNALDTYGNTALHTALRYGEWEVADLLLQRGTDVHIKNDKQETVLYHVIRKDNNNISLVQRIVELGVDINAKTTEGDTVLHRAVQDDNLLCVRYLANNGADINAKDSENKSVVEKAANYNEWRTVKYLMTEACAIVNMEQFNYILYHALYFQNIEVVEWLVQRCPEVTNINVEIAEMTSILHSCLYIDDYSEQLNIIRLCLKYGADVNALDWENDTILHKLASTDYKIVKLLLENGANVNLTNLQGNTPMHEVIKDSRNMYIENLLIKECNMSLLLCDNLKKFALDAEKYRIVHILLQHGASTNIKNSEGQTCLHLAGMHGNTQDIARMLIEHGADVHAIDNEGNTVLHTMHFGHLTTCLIENNVDLVNIKNRNGEIVLHKAVSLLDYHHSTDSPVSLLQWLHNRTLHLKQHPQAKHTMLKDVAHNSHVHSLRCIISNTKNINEKDNNGLAPLHHAAKNGNISAFKCLMKYNADVNIVTNDGDSVLHIAASNGKLDILKFILSLEQDLKLINARNNDLESVLYCAVTSKNKEIIRLILDQDVDVNTKNKHDMTALHVAVRDGQLDIVEMLVYKEADIFVCDNASMTLVHYAVKYYNVHILKFLVSIIKSKNPNNYQEILSNLKSENQESLLHVAVTNTSFELESVETIKYLVNKKLLDVNARDANGKSALHHACSQYMFQTISLLIDNGSEVNLKDNKGNTPLHIAVKIGSYEIIECIFEHGGDFNVKNQRGNTVFQIAAAHGKIKIVEYLMSKGANVNKVKNKKGLSLLHNVALSGGFKLLQYLIKSIPDINCRTNKKQTALAMVLKFKNYTKILDTLLEHDVTNIKDVYSNTELHIACKYATKNTIGRLLSRNADVNIQNKLGNTALHIAIKNNKDVEIVKILQSKYSNNDLENNNGVNVLHLSCMQNNLETIEYLVQLMGTKSRNKEGDNILVSSLRNTNINIMKWILENHAHLLHDRNKIGNDVLLECVSLPQYDTSTLQYLIDKGANVTVKNYFGNTCIHVASNCARLDYITFFLQRGLDVNTKNYVGFTALHVAAESGYVDVAKLLCENGAGVNMIDNKGRTALHIASVNNQSGVIRFLCGDGKCNLDIRDNNGFVAKDYVAYK